MIITDLLAYSAQTASAFPYRYHFISIFVPDEIAGEEKSAVGLFDIEIGQDDPVFFGEITGQIGGEGGFPCAPFSAGDGNFHGLLF
jgi:hypothetical protein